MRIALVAPLYESVPPKLYGGTERVVSYLAEELVRQGHDVTLYASADSVTSATLVATVPQALRLSGCLDPLPAHLLMLNKVAAATNDYDVIHFNIDYLHFLISRALRCPHVTTLHGRLDLPDLAPLYEEFNDIPLISISNPQRLALPSANWISTVHHGLPEALYTFRRERGGYLAFLGRLSPEKGVDRAVAIARRAGMDLWIAAKVDRHDQSYFDDYVRPLLREPHVRYLGEINEREKNKFLGEAFALLFPIDWPEPFGLVMIEAMACGTPTIAFRRGAVPEIMVDGESGFIVDDADQAVAALARVETLNRYRCRHIFEQRFTAQRMALDYLAAYRRVVAAQGPSWRVA